MGAESEEVLRRLCNGSFLSLWSIPNPYSDDGLHKRGEGKELCDLLVVFGDDVIIFSDKSCAMSMAEAPEGRPDLHWDRWYRKAVTKSVDQIFGAERWLRAFPDRVFADRSCTKPLGVKLPPAERARYHRIVVALGAGEGCRLRFEGGSGSLPIVGGGTSTMQTPPRRPFTVGDEGLGRGFVHVFDDVTLRIMLEELDTIVDFVEYLTTKERAFASTHFVATGEEDLLGCYLLNLHRFWGDDAQTPAGVQVDESQYWTLTKLPQYRAAKDANRQSYAWDRLIEHFIGRWRDEKLVSEIGVEHLESALREMAATNRLERRQLGALVLRVGQSYGQLAMSALIGAKDKTTVFAAVNAPVNAPVPDGLDLDAYRVRRLDILLLFARSLRLRHPVIKRAVVIGFGRSPEGRYSEDLMMTEFEDWSDEIEAMTKQDMALLGIGAQPRNFVDHEFPVEAPSESRAQQRRRKQIERGSLKTTKS